MIESEVHRAINELMEKVEQLENRIARLEK